METRMTRKTINEITIYFKKINKIDKPLAMCTKKRDRTQN